MSQFVPFVYQIIILNLRVVFNFIYIAARVSNQTADYLIKFCVKTPLDLLFYPYEQAFSYFPFEFS